MPKPPLNILFLDIETTGLDPYKNKMYGYAIARNSEIPVWSRSRKMVQDALNWAHIWVNHNVRFDAHFLAQNGVTIPEHLIFVDTLALAKLWDSDRLNFGLKELCQSIFKVRDWSGDMHVDMPAYACHDISMNRRLFYYFMGINYNTDVCPEYIGNTPDGSGVDFKPIVNGPIVNEILLTKVLYNMEKVGLNVSIDQLDAETSMTLTNIIELETNLRMQCGREFRDSSKFLGEILIGQRGHPIFDYTATGKPSFNKKALEKYSPLEPELIETINKFRKEKKYLSSFLDVLKKEHVKGVVHARFNQNVRTGRMSCSKPALQQQTERSKKLFHPPEGYSFISADASQIEFRIIVHYIDDKAAIEAYRNNPDNDYHVWVADLCHVDRTTGKNINFAMAFNAGKGKTLQMIGKGRTLHEATVIYNTYHQKLPGIKKTSQEAMNVVMTRGYVRNAFGRERRIIAKKSYTAFNSIVQSTAADFCKYKLVIVAMTNTENLIPVCIVHDELVCLVKTCNIAAGLKELDSLLVWSNEPHHMFSFLDDYVQYNHAYNFKWLIPSLPMSPRFSVPLTWKSMKGWAKPPKPAVIKQVSVPDEELIEMLSSDEDDEEIFSQEPL